MSKPVWIWLLSVLCAGISCRSGNGVVRKDAMFELLTASHTGIDFQNKVVDNEELNIFNFRNFYNGAGVAIGDVNNDGLPDIFFTANQGQNKLYINKGDMKFADVTAGAGLAGEGKWYTGVSMVDINGDGWLDLYVCNSGKLGSNKPNDLYINQKNGTFREEAAAYGLADPGLSTHAAFFDYDHDGDLDCFVLNNSPRSIESFGYNKSIRAIRDTLNGDRFYRNDKGKFTDVSAEAGIYGSEIGFGLGVTVGDLNNDGWEDMYISNDFFERDYLYLNNGNGSFREVINEAMGHISQGSMGSDMIDFNNDGHLDIFTTEMLPESDYKLKTTIKFDDYDVLNARLKNDFHHQFTTNCLQLNNSDGTFSEIAQLAGVDATGWSWGALSFDFDNDGWKDLFVCNGLNKDLTDQDFLEFFGSTEVLHKVRDGGFNFRDILDKMPSNKILNYAFLNNRDLTFRNATDSLGFSAPSFSNGAAYADLDNDGDLDLVINNENMPAFVYRNRSREQGSNHFLRIKLEGKGSNTAAFGTRVTMYAGGEMQMLEQMPGRGFQSCIDNVLHFGTGRHAMVDSLLIRWPDNQWQVFKNIPVDTTLTFAQGSATGAPLQSSLPSITEGPKLFIDATTQLMNTVPVHRENAFIDFDVERLMPRMLSTEGPALAVADINNDGREDIFLGNATGDTARLLIQQADGKFAVRTVPAFVGDKYFETTAAVFFDADDNGTQDLLLASGGNQAQEGSPYLAVRLYLNDGAGSFRRDSIFPLLSVNASCLLLLDYDNDGLQDIFVGARSIPGKYGVPPSSALIRNLGNGRFSDVTSEVAPVLKDLGMVTDAKFADIDNDGKKELLVVGDWMPVTMFRFDNAKLKKTGEVANSQGWWNCLEIEDINGDGFPDLLAGNTGLNSRIRATPEKPARLYVGDFDMNGQVECVPVYYKTDGRAYPYFMKGELQQQIPSLKKDFLYFRDYAARPIEEVFTRDQLKNVSVIGARVGASCAFINDGRGAFTMVPFPMMAQLSHIYSIYVSDLNGDGNQDLFMAGNLYGLKPQSGRFDASYGVTLLGDGKGGFRWLPPSQSGLFVNGEVRGIRPVKTREGTAIVAAMNNDSLRVFMKNVRRGR